MNVVLFILIFTFCSICAATEDTCDSAEESCPSAEEDGLLKTRFLDDEETHWLEEEENPQPIQYPVRNYVVINFEVYIKEAACQNSHTRSKFSVFVGSLNRGSKLVDWEELKSHDFYYDDQDKSWYVMTNVNADHLKSCLHKGGESCFPRADVIYIHFSDSSRDKWKIEYVEVNTFLAFGPRDKDHNKIDFLHNIMFPCDVNVIDEPGYYQIGPRHGLFIYHGKDKIPEIGTWVRDWV